MLSYKHALIPQACIKTERVRLEDKDSLSFPSIRIRESAISLGNMLLLLFLHTVLSQG